MKHLKYHPIKEGVGIQRDIDILQDTQDVFINLEDIFEVKVSSSFMKYLGDGVFSVYNTDGKIRNTIKTTGGSYDRWQIQILIKRETNYVRSIGSKEDSQMKNLLKRYNIFWIRSNTT